MCVKKTLYAFLISSCLQIFQCQVSAGDAPGVRSLQKCEEYKQYAFVEENKCPFDKVELAAGGEHAKPNEFPHMAAIGFGNGNKTEWDCGGSLISEDYVLTTVNCLNSSKYGAPTTVRLGRVNINDPVDGEHVQEIRIKKLIPHPEYVFLSKYNDIALLLLETRPKLGVAVRPACLFKERTKGTEYTVATGWGFSFKPKYESDLLKKTVLQFHSSEKSYGYYKSQFPRLKHYDDKIQMRYGCEKDDDDTCEVNFGGPLQFYSDVTCMYDIVGLTSFLRFCGLGFPGIYTRVYPYLKWIEDIVWP